MHNWLRLIPKERFIDLWTTAPGPVVINLVEHTSAVPVLPLLISYRVHSSSEVHQDIDYIMFYIIYDQDEAQVRQYQSRLGKGLPTLTLWTPPTHTV